MPAEGIVIARSDREQNLVKQLVEEYANSLGCSPCLEHLREDLRTFPYPFTSPLGFFLLALRDGQAAGIVGVKNVGDGAGEMGRLYVRPRFRGRNIGKGLALRSLEEARTRGYERIVLHTLPSMDTALGMYRRMGFREIPPYVSDSIAGAVFMEKRL